MTDPSERLVGWLLPSIIVAFLALYIWGIRSGTEPEVALLQAGAAGAVLAVLGRAAISIVAIDRPTTEPIDVTANSRTFQTDGEDSDEPRFGAQPEPSSGEQQQEAVGV
ncbi:MAG: hypothetical protein ACKVVP_17115 [Chloroflexota bacterium]